MAEAVATAIADAIGADFVFVAATTAVLEVSFVVGSALYMQAKGRANARKAREAFNASLTDHQVTFRSAVAPRTLTYGRDKVSGPIVFAHSNGPKKEFLHLVIPVGGHEWDAFEKYFFNEIDLPAPDSGGFITSGQFAKVITTSATQSVTGLATMTLSNTPSRIVSVTQSTGVGSDVAVTTLTSPAGYTIAGNVITFVPGAGNYTVNYEWQVTKPLVRIKKHLGTASQTADADLIAESDGKWTSAHRGDGVPYVYVRLEYDREVFGQVGLPNISVLGRGKKVLDTRTGLTVWSDNWALCSADYLRDATLGLGCSAAQVPAAEVSVAANISDETVAIDGAGATQARYTVNGTLSTATGQRDNLEAILDAGAGSAVWVQGRWLLRAGAHRSAEATLDETWLARGTLQITPRTPRSELFNCVTGTFIDPAQNYAEVQIPPVTNAVYEARDGGRRKTRTLAMPLINDSKRAQRIAKIRLERSRLPYTITVTCNMRAYDTLPTQVLNVNLARYGSSQLMEVRRRVFNPDARTVTLTLVKTASSVWNWNFGEATVNTPPNTTLPNWASLPDVLLGMGVDSTSSVQLEQATGAATLRAKVTWTQSSDIFVVRGGSIEVESKVDNATAWVRSPPVPGDATVAYVQPLEQLRKTLVRIRPVNSAGRAGDWTYALHTPQSAISIQTRQLAAQAATRITTDVHNFAGATFGNATARTLASLTPPVDCDIEVTASLMASGLNGDSGAYAHWIIQEVGSSTWTEVATFGSASTAKQMFNAHGVYHATGGVALTIYLSSERVGGTSTFWESSVRLTEVYR